LVGEIYEEMRDRFIRGRSGGWTSGQAVEGPYILEETAADPKSEKPFFAAYGDVWRQGVGQPISPFDRYMLAHFGRLLFGEATPFAPPTETDLAVQTENDLRSLVDWDAGEGHSSIWLAGMLHWIARSIVFWRDGRMLSKSAALRVEIDRGSPYAEAFGLALELRKKGAAAASDFLPDLHRHYTEMARPAAEDILRYMRTPGRKT
jgi:hypothetical protein